MTFDEYADAIEGYAVLLRTLNCIGAHTASDHELAKVVVDGELKLRALMAFAIKKLAEGEVE